MRVDARERSIYVQHPQLQYLMWSVFSPTGFYSGEAEGSYTAYVRVVKLSKLWHDGAFFFKSCR